jgi:hypothetical protein
VPWAWIKQRPHFFAEFLNKDFDVKIFYKKPLKVKKSNLVNKKDDVMYIASFFVFPFKKIPILKKISLLEWINVLLIKLQLPSLKKQDLVWVTSLSMYNYIRKILPSDIQLVYDCMDDELEFPDVKTNIDLYKEALIVEHELMKRANVILCSSNYLRAKIIERSKVNRDVLVVNNAVSLPLKENIRRQEILKVLDRLDKLENIFMYVGAISSWFDFESVIYFLDNEETVNVVLIGPADIEIPCHSRLHHLGTIDRSDLFIVMDYAKALIMPFILTELIRSVNPVKLYEYIWTAKPIIATSYGETAAFQEYAYLYDSFQEFNEIASSILNGDLLAKKNKEESTVFLENNTWEERYNSVLRFVRKV